MLSMQYRLRTLILWTAIGPPLIAIAWGGMHWFWSAPIRLRIVAIFAYLAAWIIAPLVWYFELTSWICGPGFRRTKPKKFRRVVRVRIERYAGGST